MPSSTRQRLRAIALLCGAACAPVAAASAQTGGAIVPQPIAPTAGPTGYGAPGTRAVVVTPTAYAGDGLIVRGTMPHAARRRIILQRLDPDRGWLDARRGRVRSTHRFLIRWSSRHSGRIGLRVVIAPRGHSRARTRAGGAPVAYVNVYRPSRATYFGPGLFGNKTACGQILTPLLLGVAHKHLKCGTLIALLYDGREIAVPVVDRGPYHAGYSWDLTQATAQALGFADAGRVGYIRLPPAAG